MRELRNQKGFTLMELMVVIVIVAILAAVAVPLYINYVKDAQRTEAKGAIAAVISAEQIYFQGNGLQYTNYPTETGGIKPDLEELGRNWIITATADGGNGFDVRAQHKTDPTLNVCCTYSRAADPVWVDACP